MKATYLVPGKCQGQDRRVLRLRGQVIAMGEFIAGRRDAYERVFVTVNGPRRRPLRRSAVVTKPVGTTRRKRFDPRVLAQLQAEHDRHEARRRAARSQFGAVTGQATAASYFGAIR